MYCVCGVTGDIYCFPFRMQTACSVNTLTGDQCICCWSLTLIACVQKQNCTMPEDLKNFYLTMNGFSARWSVRMNGMQYSQ